MKKTLMALVLASSLFLNCPKDQLFESFDKATNIIYQKEPGARDYWQNPTETDLIGSGDCEDKAIYLQDLLQKNGLNTKVVFGFQNIANIRSEESRQDSILQMHTWVEFEHNKVTYILDPTYGAIHRRDGLRNSFYVETKTLFDTQIEEYIERNKLVKSIFK